jgi:hypothetical protein
LAPATLDDKTMRGGTPLSDSPASNRNCSPRYGAAARDGSTLVEQQDFSYSTSWAIAQPIVWTSKQTTVATTDLTQPSHPHFKSVCMYLPNTVPDPPNIITRVANQVPRENTITYQDWTGAVLRTVTNWVSGATDLLASEQTTFDNPQTGPTSKTAYSYGTLGVLHEKDEYNFGSGAPAALLRKNRSQLPALFCLTPVCLNL